MKQRISISVINDLVTDQRLHRLAGSLFDRGYVVVVTGRMVKGSLPYADSRYMVKRFNMLIRSGPLFYAFYNIRLFFMLMVMKKPEILISVDLDTLPANYLASRFRSIPLVYDCHEYFTEVPELIGRPIVKKTWERLERLILPKLKHNITVSTSIASEYMKKYGARFVVVRNVSMYREPVLDAHFHTAYPSRYKIIYQGALNLGRGVEVMISSMKYIDDTTLFIVGDGDIREELHLLASRLKVNHKVIFLGKVPPEQLHRITCQCNLGLSLEADMGLSYRYALPNKIFDYVQARIPVLCSNLPEMAAVVKKFEIGAVCDEREPEKVAARIRKVLSVKWSLSPEREKLNKAAENLCWEKEEKVFLELVNESLKSGGWRYIEKTDL